jgi:polar amino acid transport system permease protein
MRLRADQGSTVTDSWQPSPRELARRADRQALRTRSIAVSAVAVVLVFAGLYFAVVLSPGWPRVRELFFNGQAARQAFPDIWRAFWRYNVLLFLLAEPLILIVALAVALARGARAAWLVPLRILAAAYTDVFRGIPTILLVLMLGVGVPALNLQGIPKSLFFWALMALVLSYGAYVAEVFRAGIESIHPSQIASAEALGLSRPQTMRFVVIPQAVRRVGPPLLNDFVSLQKDTALVSSVALFDALFAARDYAAFNFNYTPYVVVAGYFVVLTVPLARLTDWLQRRANSRERGAR